MKRPPLIGGGFFVLWPHGMEGSLKVERPQRMKASMVDDAQPAMTL